MIMNYVYLFLYAYKIDEIDGFAKLTGKKQALKSTVVSIFSVKQAPISSTNVKISALFEKKFKGIYLLSANI